MFFKNALVFETKRQGVLVQMTRRFCSFTTEQQSSTEYYFFILTNCHPEHCEGSEYIHLNTGKATGSSGRHVI